jgi:serine/threonine-protein kinase
VVYLATTESGGLRRNVAIKVLHPDKAKIPGLLGRMRDEARIMSFVKHRAIVRVDDLVELDGNWAIVMEYVEGCDIATLLERGPLPPAVAVHVARDVALALHTAAQQPGPDGRPLNLIHRDIKPSNIRLSAHGEVKLLDFGVARAEFHGREAGSTRVCFGTLPYLSPERAEGIDSHAGDVYALGVSLFEMLTGEKPGKQCGSVDRHPPGGARAVKWTFIRMVAPSLHDLVAEMLADDPAARPSAFECARRLRDIEWLIHGESIEDWTDDVVPGLLQGRRPEHPCAGLVLSESSSGPHPVVVEADTLPQPPAPIRPRPTTRLLPWMAGGLFAASVVSVAVLLVAAAVLWPHPDKAVAAPPVAMVAVPTLPVAAPPPPAVEAPPPVVETPTPTPPPVVEPPPPRARASRKPSGAPEKGTLRVVGSPVTISVHGAAGNVRLGSVAPGTYVADVTFEGGRRISVRGIDVVGGKTTTLTCSADFNNCRPSVE